MSRTFKTVDYEAALDLTVRLGDCLPPDHLARFVVDSVGLLDLSAIYARYGSRGGEPYAGAPRVDPLWVCDGRLQFAQDRAGDVRGDSVPLHRGPSAVLATAVIRATQPLFMSHL
jgi:hypothetical protein